jgi:hypothetical protein
MADANKDWAIEHEGEQRYDIVSLLVYNATNVEMWGPDATDPRHAGQEEWRQTVEWVDRSPASPGRRPCHYPRNTN